MLAGHPARSARFRGRQRGGALRRGEDEATRANERADLDRAGFRPGPLVKPGGPARPQACGPGAMELRGPGRERTAPRRPVLAGGRGVGGRREAGHPDREPARRGSPSGATSLRPGLGRGPAPAGRPDLALPLVPAAAARPNPNNPELRPDRPKKNARIRPVRGRATRRIPQHPGKGPGVVDFRPHASFELTTQERLNLHRRPGLNKPDHHRGLQQQRSEVAANPAGRRARRRGSSNRPWRALLQWPRSVPRLRRGRQVVSHGRRPGRCRCPSPL